MKSRCPAIADVRGIGAMQAMVFMEFMAPGREPEPATELVGQIIGACRERGLMVIPAGACGNVVRVLCPLVIGDEELEQGLCILEEEVMRLTGVLRASAVSHG